MKLLRLAAVSCALLTGPALAQTVYLGDHAVGATVYFPLGTYDSNGASVSISGLAVGDIEAYKNGSMTQRSSDAGYTLLDADGTDLDGSTGFHGFSIDTSNNTDTGFWVAGSYIVNVDAITVDSQTVRLNYAFTLGRMEAAVASALATYDPPTQAELNARTLASADYFDPSTDGVRVTHWNGVALATTNPLPNAAAGASGGLPLGDASGRVLLQPTQSGVTIPTVTTLTNVPANFTSLGISAGGVVNANIQQAGGAAISQAGGLLNANVTQVSGDGAAADSFEAILDLIVGQSGSFAPWGIKASGTATAYTSGTPSVTLATAEAFGDDTLIGNVIWVRGSSGATYWQEAIITDNVGSTDVATIDEVLPVTPSGTLSYIIWGTPNGQGGATPAEMWAYSNRTLTSGANIALAKGTGVTGFNDLSSSQVAAAVLDAPQSSHNTAGTIGERLGRIPNAAPGGNGGLPTVNASNQVAGVSGNVVGTVGGVAGNVTGSVGSVTGNVGGNVVGNVNGSVGSLGTTAQSNVQTSITAALNAFTIDGELLTDLLCRVASGMYGAQATDPSANGGNGQSVYSNAAGTEIRFTVNYGADAGDRSSVSLGASCGN